MNATGNSKFWYAVIGLLLLMAINIWVASGTLAPYGATYLEHGTHGPCHYIVNIDHDHFEAVYRLLRGDGNYAFSVVLRRPLFYLFAYPFMAILGFDHGGFWASLFLHMACAYLFCRFLVKREGETASLIALALLAAYPGITYWAALPYSYSAIVPCTLLLFLCLTRLVETENNWETLLLSAAMGVLFLGYDLLPFFGGSAAALLWLRGRAKWILPALGLMALPLLCVILYLSFGLKLPLKNANTVMYPEIIFAYLHPGDLRVWFDALVKLPIYYGRVFLFSNFLWLPLLFISSWGLARASKMAQLTAVEIALIVSTIGIFLFINVSPPHPGGWQLAGTLFTRIYQPVFVAFLVFIGRAGARFLAKKTLRPVFLSLLVVTLLGNLVIIWGPLLNLKHGEWAYNHFYPHAPIGSMQENLDKHGRRPLGFCK